MLRPQRRPLWTIKTLELNLNTLLKLVEPLFIVFPIDDRVT